MIGKFARLAAQCGAGMAAILCVSPLATAGDAPSRTSATFCDRLCLQGFVDQYLTALEARDPNRAPFADHARFTEQGVELRLGDGAWGTVTSIDKDYRIYIADEERGEVAFIGIGTENWEQPGIFALRIRVQDGRISEAETLWGRTIPGAKSLLERGRPRPAFSQSIPETKRLSRDRLVAIANTYFTGLQDNDGTREVRFSKDCNRIENGTQTTNNKSGTPRPGAPAAPSWTCDQQFRSGYFRIDTDLRDRRFRVVDPERGLVFAFGFFDHSGNVLEYDLADGQTVQSSMLRPHSWMIAELFKVNANEELDQIEAVLFEAPYGMRPAWFDCSGVFPHRCIEPGPAQTDIRVGRGYPDRVEAMQKRRQERQQRLGHQSGVRP